MTYKDKIKGKVNEAVGKLTDDEKQELKGKEMTDDVANKVNKKVDEHDRKR